MIPNDLMARGNKLAITSSNVCVKNRRDAKAIAINSKGYKELGCRDFKAHCDFMVLAETADEVMKYCQQHACAAHSKCASSSESREKIKSHIRNVRG